MLKSIKKTNLLMMSSIILFMAFITIYLFRNCDFNDVIYEIETLPYFTKVSAMIALIALQIFLAFLPGEPLELASGYIFWFISRNNRLFDRVNDWNDYCLLFSTNLSTLNH